MEPCLGGCGIVSSGQGRLGPLSLGHMYWNTSSFPLVQAGYLIKGRFPCILRQDKSLGLKARGRRQGPRSGERDPDPGAGIRNLEAETWKPEAGVISS
ncbi:hypothetical protein DY000_02030968 [Brassica cretica]|uniref:Uncharacterized protein n=1 Tax=Brassica cretica TaxID=69181 RepID=A0ABQ7DUI2_BRACR|nr:hypothetical protein DY000_02030968 [Brassica cretica]